MPIKLVQAATEGLPSLTRRLFIGGAAVASLPIAAAALPIPSEAQASIDEFLAKALPTEKIRYHSNALAEAMAEMHPERTGWRIHTDHDEHLVLVAPSPRPMIRFMETARDA